jgi:tetratricopeptide (TPR) repeat protein
VPARLTPIFKDREDLAAAHDLTDEVRAALSASACLIVLATPAAAASLYVAHEIALFRSEHPDRPILVALWDGEPDAAFPPALRLTAAGTPIEPLAADFRKTGDGRRLALLKLVAGISGVELDALVQREAQRRLRRVTAVTVAAVIGMLAMGLLTAFAFSARAEAERQRGEAEGLVEFMLTDLRDNLKAVGRLDVLTSANKRALAYYGHQDVAAMAPESLERRARILQAMGEDDEQRGDLATAAASFNEAERTTAALVARYPGNADRLYNYAQSVYWRGLLAWRRGDLAAAGTAWRQYADLAAALNRMAPGKAEWIMESGYAASNLGTLALRGVGDPVEAEEHFERSREAFVKAALLLPEDTDPWREIADADAWIADCRKAAGDWQGALAARAQQAETLARLQMRDPRDAKLQLDRLRNQLGTARVEISAGAPAEARARIDAAEKMIEALNDPENRDIARLATMLALVRAEALLAMGVNSVAAGSSLADCRAPTLRHDIELDAFCKLLLARLQIQRGDPHALATLALAKARLPDARATPSTRWNIDFATEIAKSENVIVTKGER